jgi:hypothetical protein
MPANISSTFTNPPIDDALKNAKQGFIMKEYAATRKMRDEIPHT